ncbi:MAG: tetratricopeptide repeat-containing S1 family peptidase [Pseudonocardiales bacterium]
MSTRVESAELRRYVVRVDSEDRQPQGSGFFVAPGWVLTCAHVVKAAERVIIVPVQGAMPIPATVAARSATRIPGPSGFWPFPDLALIRLDTALEHPCVLLDTRTPVDGECHSWGYATREDGVTPTGSPASFRFEGVEGDDYLKLKAGQAPPGLSGAPLVCPGRRAVVGVMSMTRDKHDALGGWAAPISALLTGGPGVPEDLATLGSEIRRANRAAVLRDRASWHRVLPVEGSNDVLLRPWWTFRKTRRPDPADLLLAGFGVVPYLFRDADISAAVAWCESAEALVVSVVPGHGGAGKTRFAVELCKRMEHPDHGWVSGMWDDKRVAAADLAALALPRLIVVDYTESEDLPALQSLLDRLRRQATDIAPARVLLLTRAGVAGRRDPILTLREIATPSVKQILDDRDISTAASELLTIDQREALYRCAVDEFATAWQISPTTVVPNLSASGYSLPLEVLFEALDQTLSNGDNGPDLSSPAPALDRPVTPQGRSPVERVLIHEEKYWAGDCPINDTDLRRTCVALATLAGAADNAEADALMSLLPALRGDHMTAYRRRVTDWLANLHEGTLRLNPLRPDRLGEALIGKMLRREDDGGAAVLTAVLGLSDDQITRCLEVLARLTVGNDSAASATAHALAQQHIDLILRAEAQASGRPDRPGRMNLASGLIRIYTGLIANRVLATLPDRSDQRDLSVSYDKLADLALAVGQTDEARQLCTQSLSIAEALATAEPGNTTYQRDLSVSFNKLADLALAVGQTDEARQLCTQSLSIAEALATAEPGNTTYQGDLSVSFNKLADLALAVGQTDEARQLCTQSLSIREALATAEPGNTTYQRDLSVSYERMGALAEEAQEQREATEWFVKALALRRALNAQEPQRIDLAQELAVCLYFVVRSDHSRLEEIEHELIDLLSPFEISRTITEKAASILRWARE